MKLTAIQADGQVNSHWIELGVEFRFREGHVTERSSIGANGSVTREYTFFMGRVGGIAAEEFLRELVIQSQGQLALLVEARVQKEKEERDAAGRRDAAGSAEKSADRNERE